MASLGSFLLLATFVVCSYAAVASVVGARRGSRPLIESGIGAFYLVAALMAGASAVILNAFVTDDFSIKYVVHYSESAQPLFYKLTSFWGGLDGSIMFWALLLAVFSAIAVYVNREQHRELIPYVVATISIVQMFFLFLMVVHKNPFSTYLGTPPADGEGLNPLLQNYWMVIHPPALYTGFVGMTIPFAFGLAALITGQLDDAWLRAVRRWTMFSWLFLSFGLALGMIWAYEELGWGGYWGWDPVENAALLPWFTATAFLHSVIVQERRGMLKVWNVTLVILTFFLTIFGTFMTRSGVVQSIHAFGEDRELGWMFAVFMVAILTVSFGLVIYRLPLLKARHDLDSWMSREAAFLVNNWVLLFSAFFVLFATMFPTLSEAVTGQRLTVAEEFFNKWMLPIGLILLTLTGIGPMLAWRKSSLVNLRDQFMWPGLAALVAAGGFVALGFRVWASGLCVALCAFVVGSIGQEFWRGTRVRQGNTGTDFLTALIGLVARNKRRYGGYIVHTGIVLIFLGFAGDGFQQDQQIMLKVGEQTTLGQYTIRHDKLSVTDDGQKQMITGHLAVFADGTQVATAYPAKWSFHKHQSEPPTTEVWIRRGFVEDLYIVLGAFDAATQAVTLLIYINPLVNWVWLGFGILAFGTGISLLPDRTFSFALAKLPAAEAATTAVLLVAFLFGSAGPAVAQHEAGAAGFEGDVATSYYARTDLERALQKELVCPCGSCGHAPIGECRKDPCGTSHRMRAELAAFIDEGKSREEIIQAFISTYGSQEILGAPIDKGFNRLAWFIPYLIGASGAVLIGFAAVRWSRSGDVAPKAEAEPSDPSLDARLDDELRDLD